jgi:hypothetical protein
MILRTSLRRPERRERDGSASRSQAPTTGGLAKKLVPKFRRVLNLKRYHWSKVLAEHKSLVRPGGRIMWDKAQAQVRADTRSAPRVRLSEYGPEQRGRTDLPESNAGYPDDKGPSRLAIAAGESSVIASFL